MESTEDKIKAEAAQSAEEYPDGYLESIVLYREIAEKLPFYSAFVFHGAVIAVDGKAYAVTARSGVGKTTHLRLWQEVFGDKVHVLNGDKPIIRIIEGEPYACGTPWRGKERYGVNEMLPLCGIGFLERAEENSAERIEVGEALMKFMTQIYVPKERSAATIALGTADRVLNAVPLIRIRANMKPDAAITAYKAFVNN